MKDNARNARNFVISWIIATGILLIGLMSVSMNASAASASNMTDIPSGSWYESAVRYCLNNNYMSGESETKFNPNGTVSRAQMVQVLYNLEGQPGYTPSHTPFEDITPGSWYYNAVRWSEENGIASGTSATTFKPNTPVTREQVATFFANYAKFKNNYSGAQSDLSKYSDRNKISSWAKENISWAVNYGLMSGTSSTTLDPQGTCIRAQLAQFIKNYYHDDSQVVPEPTPEPTPDPDENPVIKPDGEYAPVQTGGKLISEGKVWTDDSGETWIQFPEYDIGADLNPVFDPSTKPIKPVPTDDQPITDVDPDGFSRGRWTELGYIPVDGYVKNGRIYNSMGYDVTSVDGKATANEMSVLEDINEYRRNAGIPELKWSETLQYEVDERAIEAMVGWETYMTFVEPNLENGTIPKSVELSLSMAHFGHRLWNESNPVSISEILAADPLSEDLWIPGTTYVYEHNIGHYLADHVNDSGDNVTAECGIYSTLPDVYTCAADGWYESSWQGDLPGHRQIMMSPSYTTCAVGIYTMANGHTNGVALFR